MTTSNSSLTSITATESATSIAREELSIDDDDGEPGPTHLKSDESQEGDESEDSDERTLITHLLQIFKSYAPQSDLIDYRDDCASLTAQHFSGDAELLFTTDALCEGVHFDLKWDQYSEVGAQAAVANLSDLASSGAHPRALLWSLSIPEQISHQDVQDIAHGFGETAGRWSCPVIGGNLCVRPGPLEIHVTAVGSTERRAITRVGARPGDAIYVTGTLGDRALGYLDPTLKTRALRHQWRPHLREAYSLSQWGHVTAMLDISDGLLIDLERLAQVNQVTAAITRDRLPLSDSVRAHPLGDQAALSGGEDYVLLFTAPQDLMPPSETHATLIGYCDVLQDNTSLLTLDGLACAGEGHLYQIKNLSLRTE
jgi:thiamine-monophosphate kinase